MKFLEKATVLVGLTVVGVTVVYRNVLTDDHRAALKEAGDAIRSAFQEVTDMIIPLVSNGPTKAEERAASEQNRANTAAQWEELGY